MAGRNLPPGWRRVALADVLPEAMIDDLIRLHHANTLTQHRLRELTDNPTYAAFMEAHGLNPRFAFYWLAHNLGVWS